MAADSATVSGLSSSEAAALLEQWGANALVAGEQRGLVFQLLARFRNPLVMLLLGASALSAATGDLRGALVISVIVLLSITLDFVQEHRAGRAAEKLRSAASVSASVSRDGRVVEIPAAQLVPGDVVNLCAGDLVPADARLVESRALFVNQALLTGEPYPVEKQVAADSGEPNDPSGDAGAVFMGSSVLSGSGRARIARTGSRTTLGRIGVSLSRPAPPTAFELGIRSFGLLIVRIAFGLVLFVIAVELWRGRPWLESFLFATALAVGLTPELLPMVISVTLARGAMRMAKKQVLVKRLSAIHDLGSMDVLCTDKTGTLTEARIRLEQHLDPLGRDSARVFELAYLNSFFQSGLRSPLDQAILQHETLALDDYRKLDEVPFDFERRRVSVLVARGARQRLIVKGAFEDILGLCSQVDAGVDEQVEGLDAERKRALTERFAALSADGYRVLGIAWKAEAISGEHATIDDETQLIFAGFASFEDPPKSSAGEALRALVSAGITPIIVSGDNELVTQHVCKQLGVPVRGVLTGVELQRLDDHALAIRVESTNLFCRVTPNQKSRIIRAFKQRGHVVGYLGDGINDAPSLHAADVGISVDGAVDVAKEAADLILMQHDLGVLRSGVIEGRRTLGNILKYIMMGTSSNFGNMFSMAGAALFLPFLPMLPMQILLNNLLYDLSELPLPTDRVDPDFSAVPHRLDIAFIRRFMLVIGPISSVFDFATFYLLLRLFGGNERLFHSGWFVESLATQVLVIFVIRTRGNPFRSRPSTALVVAALGIVALASLLPYLPFAPAFGFAPLPPVFFAFLLALTATYLLCVEGVKRLFYAHYEAQAPR